MADFLSSHFLFSRLIGLHILMCFILLALSSLNLPQPWPQLYVYILIVFLIGKYVTRNASRARAELGPVLNSCLDINDI